jgi:hypothetical protein
MYILTSSWCGAVPVTSEAVRAGEVIIAMLLEGLSLSLCVERGEACVASCCGLYVLECVVAVLFGCG